MTNTIPLEHSIDGQSQIFKVSVQKPSTARKPPTWSKGSNAKFNFTSYAYVSRELEAAADEELESQKREHSHGHPTSSHDHGRKPKDAAKSRGEVLQQRAEVFESMLSQLSLSAKKTSPGNSTAKKVEGVAPTDPMSNQGHGTTEKSVSALKKSEPPQRRKIGDSRELDPAKPFEMRVGLGFSVPCLEKCVKTMSVGEKARFLCLPEECEGYAQLESVLRQEKRNRELAAKGLPPQKMFGCCAHANVEDTAANRDLLLLVGSPLEFEIELLSVQEPGEFIREVWEMSAKEKLEEAPLRKEEGSTLYRAGDYIGAEQKYCRALILLESLSMSPAVTDVQRAQAKEAEERLKLEKRRADERKRLAKLGRPIPEELKEDLSLPNLIGTKIAGSVAPTDDIDPKTVLDLMKTTRLNYAACKLKLLDYPTVIVQCSEVLKSDPKCAKALFRRAQAYMRLGRDIDLAGEDLETLRSIYNAQGLAEDAPERVELKREEAALDKLVKLSREKEKRMWGNIFS